MTKRNRREKLYTIGGKTFTWDEVKDYVGKGIIAESTAALKEMQTIGPVTLEAHKIVFGRGEHDYGHPADNFQHTANLWNAQFSAILGDSEDCRFTSEDVAYAMILLKLSRQEHMPKRDNLVDIAGYAETAQRVVAKRERDAVFNSGPSGPF